MKKDITPKDLRKMLENGKDLRIVDVRSASEFATGHIPGAVNLPLDQIDNCLPGQSCDDPTVLVCLGGVRSSAACERVMKTHKNIYNLVGGMNAWKAEGLEVEAGPKAPRSVERQTHLVAGLLITTALYLSFKVNPNWIYLAALPAFGLLLDAFTGICPMTLILKKMPWNA